VLALSSIPNMIREWTKEKYSFNIRISFTCVLKLVKQTIITVLNLFTNLLQIVCAMCRNLVRPHACKEWGRLFSPQTRKLKFYLYDFWDIHLKNLLYMVFEISIWKTSSNSTPINPINRHLPLNSLLVIKMRHSLDNYLN